MTVKFDRPIDFSYNADLNSMATAINQLIDYIEAKEAEKPKPARRPRAKNPASK